MRILKTEELFSAILASSSQGGAEGRAQAAQIADRAAHMLERGTSPDAVARIILATMPHSRHTPFSILRVEADKRHPGVSRAWLVECDAPPLFMTRRGQLVLLPVLEEDIVIGRGPGHLVRTCQFLLQAGDHLAMVSEGYIHARGWSRRWGWRDIANSIRRWTDTGSDAEGLLGALVRMYCRLAEGANPYIGETSRDVTVIAMHVRPVRTVTIWTGPPADPAQDAVALERLMAEPGLRIICGDTTAQIAARLLGAELELEPRPADGVGHEHPWAEVPPVSILQGVGLVTEGLVTLNKARQRMREAQRMGSLPRGEDGATRLTRVLLSADRIHWIVGLAVNPAQAALPRPPSTGSGQAPSTSSGQALPGREGEETALSAAQVAPLRQVAVDELIRDLRARGKLVSVEYL